MVPTVSFEAVIGAMPQHAASGSASCFSIGSCDLPEVLGSFQCSPMTFANHRENSFDVIAYIPLLLRSPSLWPFQNVLLFLWIIYSIIIINFNYLISK